MFELLGRVTGARFLLRLTTLFLLWHSCEPPSSSVNIFWTGTDNPGTSHFFGPIWALRWIQFFNVINKLSLSSLLWRPTQLYLRGRGEGEPKNEVLLFKSTVDIHFQNVHEALFQYTVDIYFQKAHKTQKLRKLAPGAFIFHLKTISNAIILATCRYSTVWT